MIDNINATQTIRWDKTTPAISKLTPAEDKKAALNKMLLNIVVQGVNEAMKQNAQIRADGKKQRQEEGLTS